VSPLALFVLLTSGCFLGYEGAFIEAEDVSLDTPGQIRSRMFDDGEQGDVYVLVEDTATDVNGWVSEMVDGIATIVAFLNEHRETSREGEWRVYGPFNDDEGRDLSWLVRIQGDAESTAFEVRVGERGASSDEVALLLDGDIDIDENVRTGGFTLHFDTVEDHPGIKDLEDAGKTFAGEIDVSFVRDVSTEHKTIDIDFRGFVVENVFGESWSSDESYAYHRADDGSGEFHLALLGTFDDNAWGGIRRNRLALDARWTAEEAGRARGQILGVEHEDGALPDGDLVIFECFDGDGNLTWREINDPYAAEIPSYNMGDEATCAFTEDEL
jgi:hypothetical protein